jgi:hypothetical protein
MQFVLLAHIQTEAFTPSPSPTKYPDIIRIIEMDMAAGNVPAEV